MNKKFNKIFIYKKLLAITVLVLISAVIAMLFSGCKDAKKESNSTTTGTSPTVSSASTGTSNTATTSSTKSIIKYSPFPDKLLGYTAILPLKDEIDDFEYGVDLPYNRDPYNKHPELKNSSPHYWSDVKPVYSYSPSASGASLNYMATTGKADNCNYWNVYPSANGSKGGYVDAVYVTNLPGKENYEILELYQKLYVTYNGINSDGKNVNLTISLFSATTQKWVDLISYTGKSGKKTIIECDLTKVPADALLTVQNIRFRTYNNMSGMGFQKNEIYEITARSNNTYKTKTATVENLSFDSEYLGNVKMTRWGAYSASGFFDMSDKKWKIWYGAGIPEGTASDNVYYMETTDPQKEWSTPKRLIIKDPKKILVPYNQPPAYGGDPSVIKVNGIYYMYFSKIASNPKSTSYWFNQIYLATSTDGVNFTLYNTAIVDCPDGGKAGYGSGSPSVVYKDGTFYLYYYSQYEPLGGFFLRTSKDGKSFGSATRLAEYGGDVVYVPSLKKWLMCYYTEEGQGGNFSSGGVRIAVSNDGKNWTMGNDDKQLPAQNPYPSINHNPGWIRDPLGQGYKTMFLTYGYNDLPLLGEGTQMDTRQLEWSRVSFK